jgi:hypothetical protein
MARSRWLLAGQVAFDNGYGVSNRSMKTRSRVMPDRNGLSMLTRLELPRNWIKVSLSGSALMQLWSARLCARAVGLFEETCVL